MRVWPRQCESPQQSSLAYSQYQAKTSMMFVSTILISCIIIALNNNISTTVHAVVENSNTIKSITNDNSVRHNNVWGSSNKRMNNIRRRLQDKPDDDQVAVDEILDEVSTLEEEKKEVSFMHICVLQIYKYVHEL